MWKKRNKMGGKTRKKRQFWFYVKASKNNELNGKFWVSKKDGCEKGKICSSGDGKNHEKWKILW